MGQAIKVNPPAGCVTNSPQEPTSMLDGYLGGIILLLLGTRRTRTKDESDRPRKRRRLNGRSDFSKEKRGTGLPGGHDAPVPPPPLPAEQGTGLPGGPYAQEPPQPPPPPQGTSHPNLCWTRMAATMATGTHRRILLHRNPPPAAPAAPTAPTKGHRIRIASYTIISGRQTRLDTALQAMDGMNIDLGFLLEAKG